ncbi:hypothetical protein GCM10027348_42760 [Hymenobacter tenuis]
MATAGHAQGIPKLSSSRFEHHIVGSKTVAGSSLAPVKHPALYVVDGTPMTREQLDGISPSQIQHIRVAKDSLSRAAYGPRAKDGVVFITMKK